MQVNEAKRRLHEIGERVEALCRAGKYLEAKPQAEEAVALAEKDPENMLTTSMLDRLARLLQAMGDLKGARSLFERALALEKKALGIGDSPSDSDLKKIFGPCRMDREASADNLASMLQATGDFNGARQIYERNLAIRERSLGPDNLQTERSLTNLASVLQAMGDFNGARPLYERALAIYEAILGPDHPGTATSLSNLAALLQAMGDLKGARPLFERALAIKEKALGLDHPDTVQVRNNLVALVKAEGE